MDQEPKLPRGKPFTANDPRTAKTRFRKGMSGNPHGRAPGLGKYIRAQLGEGKESVDMLITIMRKGAVALRIQAIRELHDRGWGKAEATTVIRNQDDTLRIMDTIRDKGREVLGDVEWGKLVELLKSLTPEDLQ